MNDMKELMTSLVTVQAAGIKAGLQAGDAERERLRRERDEALKALRDLSDAVTWRHRDADNLDRAHNAAANVLAKHGRLPT